MFQTKLNLSNTKFEQTSGSTLNLNGSLSINSFSATTFTISQQPQLGASGDTILVRANDGTIKGISQSGITGGGGTTLTFNNGLTQQGDVVSLGGVLTGDTKINTYNISTYNTANFSIGGYGTCANASYGGSFAVGNNVTTCGAYSIAMGSFTIASSLNSIAIGYGGGTGKEVLASGVSSKNISNNNISQIDGHGALGYASSIFGGKNHNITYSNYNATIIGGNAIKLTGNTYIDTTIVGKFAIFSGLTSGTTGDTVLVRDTSTGIIKEVLQSNIGQTLGFENGLNLNNNIVKLGGTLTEDTNISTGGFFGYGFGIGNQICASGRNSISFGSYTNPQGVNGMSIGYATQSILDGAFSGGMGYFQGPYAIDNRPIIANGIGSFNFSTNTCDQFSGYGAGSKSTAILGGVNHNISNLSENSTILGGYTNRINGENVNTTILGGKNIILNGSGYTDTAVVSRFAIFSGLTAGTTGDTVLVRDGSTGIIKGVSQSSLGGSGGGTTLSFNNGLTQQGDIVSLGGVLTGNTLIESSGNSICMGNFSYGTYASGADSIAIGKNTQVAGIGSLSLGWFTKADGNCSIAIGSGARSYVNNSIAIGYYSRACASGSVAMGGQSTTYGNYSFAANGAAACGIYSAAFGQNSFAIGTHSMVHGCRTCASGSGSFSSGIGYSASFLAAIGCGSFNHSVNTVNGAGGACSSFSAILGGTDHTIELGNTRAAIIGGANIVLTGTTYIDTTAVSKLAIMSTPSGGTSGDTVLVRDGSTGIIKGVSQSSLGGSGGGTTINSNNTEIIFNNNGTITGNTALTFNSSTQSLTHGIRTGIAGNNSAVLAGAYNACASGENSLSVGRSSYVSGDNSIGMGYYSNVSGDNSFGFYSTVAGIGSVGLAGASVTGNYSFGVLGTADGLNSISLGGLSLSNRSITIGRYTRTTGIGGTTIGYGFDPNITSNLLNFGDRSINISTKTISNSDVGLFANDSAIFGGLNNTIESGNTNTVLIGGSSLSLTGTSYIGHTVVGDFAIFNNPSSGISTDSILVRDNTTGIIKQIPQSGITGGSGTTELNILNITGTTSATLSVDNHVIIVDTTSAPQTITLPSAPQNGLNFKVKDNGNALTNEITISGNGKNIDGISTASINTNYGALELIYQQSVDTWYILSFNS